MTSCQSSRLSNLRLTTTFLRPRQCSNSRTTTLSYHLIQVKHRWVVMAPAICKFESRSRTTRVRLQLPFSWTTQPLRWSTKSKGWRSTRRSRGRCRQSLSREQWVTRCELRFKHSSFSWKWSSLCSKMHLSTCNESLNATTIALSWWANLNCCSRLLTTFLTWDSSVMEFFAWSERLLTSLKSSIVYATSFPPKHNLKTSRFAHR